jgi:FtsZ-binding cell division protein ZapB
MKDLIYKHETVDDIQMKFMDKDIELWKEDISIIRIEILFFKRMLYSSIFKELESNQQKKDDLIKDLKKVKEINESYQDKLIDFMNKLDNIKECDDVQCETFYLNNHTKFRNDIESHFSAYRFYKTNVILFFDNCLEDMM